MQRASLRGAALCWADRGVRWSRNVSGQAAWRDRTSAACADDTQRFLRQTAPPEVILAILEAYPDAARGAAGLELLEFDEAAVDHDERPLITMATLL